MGVGSRRGWGWGGEAGGGAGAAAEFGKVERICPFARVYEIYSRKNPGERMVGQSGVWAGREEEEPACLSLCCYVLGNKFTLIW